jgi:mono/diheme cytochrome c family protein
VITRHAAPVARVLCVGALLIAGSAKAQQATKPTAPDTNAITPAMVDLGRAIFHGKGTCFACHGGQLEGSQIAPTLKAHPWRDAKNGQLDEIFRVATHGVSGTVMVAFPGGISPAEAQSVASYIWSVNNRGAKP